jgi:hypothetical protein
MSDSATLTLDSAAFRQALHSLAERAPLRVRDAFGEIGAEQLRVVRTRLGPRYNKLASSVQLARSELTVRSPMIRIGSARPEAAIVNFGGTIRTFEQRGLAPTPDAIRRRVYGSKPLKYLTIPLTNLGTPAYARARDYQNLFVMNGKWFKRKQPGKLYLAQKLVTGSNAKTQKKVRGFASRHSRKIGRATKAQKKTGFRLLFALVKAVTIQRRPYLYWSPQDTTFATRVILRHLSLEYMP